MTDAKIDETNFDKIDPESIIELADDSSTDDDASSYFSDTTSLTSSVFNFTYENGRRYSSHRKESGNHFMPNDEVEQDRLDLMHHLILTLNKGSLYEAPLENPQSALDLGTGTGIWAVDFADTFPDCKVIGTDLAPIQTNYVPPNLSFEVDDYELEWVYKEKFDYIHIRYLMGGVKDWPTLFKKAYDFLNPGGYIEIYEADFTAGFSQDGTYENSIVSEYIKHVGEASSKIGRKMDEAPKLPGYLGDVGFTNVHMKKIRCPIGAWPKDASLKEAGKIAAVVTHGGVEAYGLALLTRVLGWSTEEAKDYCKKVEEKVMDRRIHAIWPMYAIYAQKPLEE
ncbi:S-adenosyl-L-methionine-dependent methyltransferase [Ascobolus immersus RN42]|uniref:S-adenosyl-L-methionine-dependent methyltransferase n=1 Tax=Ascobolus immersus RN42 TaxID=1160509 RepID=A0A3N4IHB7_ASCIM|nr:S-adenosyl-L-methionine-dependent methyltransferase [Ascobolus immersus RN42]